MKFCGNHVNRVVVIFACEPMYSQDSFDVPLSKLGDFAARGSAEICAARSGNKLQHRMDGGTLEVSAARLRRRLRVSEQEERAAVVKRCVS